MRRREGLDNIVRKKERNMSRKKEIWARGLALWSRNIWWHVFLSDWTESYPHSLYLKHSHSLCLIAHSLAFHVLHSHSLCLILNIPCASFSFLTFPVPHSHSLCLFHIPCASLSFLAFPVPHSHSLHLIHIPYASFSFLTFPVTQSHSLCLILIHIASSSVGCFSDMPAYISVAASRRRTMNCWTWKSSTDMSNCSTNTSAM